MRPGEVLAQMRKQGIQRVRIPLPWTMFPPPQSEGFVRNLGFVADPFAREETALPMCTPAEFLLPWLEEAARNQIYVLLDIHTLPGQTGPGHAPQAWTTAIAAMSYSERQHWLRAHAHIWDTLILYTTQLPSRIAHWICGLEPFNQGLLMDADGFSVPLFPGRHATSQLAQQLADQSVQRYGEEHGKRIVDARSVCQDDRSALPALYLNVENAMLPSEVEANFVSWAQWFTEQGICPASFLVRCRHVFALNLNRLTPPTRSDMRHWVLSYFRPYVALPWRECCIEWSSTPPRSVLFRNQVASPITSVPDEWKDDIYEAFLEAFETLQLENYFWTWDVPDCCPIPAIPSQSRAYWSLRCALKG